jgi:type IV secretory pathway TrbL component
MLPQKIKMMMMIITILLLLLLLLLLIIIMTSVAISGDRNVIKKETEKTLKY